MSISTLFARGLLTEVHQRGFSMESLLEGTGLRQADFVDIHGRAPIEALVKLIENALRLTGDPALGLTAAEHAPPNALQVLSHLALSCKTLRQALEALHRHAPYVSEGSVWELAEREQRAYWFYARSLPNEDVSRVVADGVLAAIVRLARFFAPERAPTEVWFCHRQPAYAREYVRLFRCQVRFSQPRNAVVLDRALLDRPQLFADEPMVVALHDVAARMLHPARGAKRLSEKLRTLLRNEKDIREATIVSLARRLGMSERTLRTRLGEEGVRFSDLTDEVRCELACLELRRKDASIKTAADRAGFTERSSFHRAFKRWTGKTPAEYMAENA